MMDDGAGHGDRWSQSQLSESTSTAAPPLAMHGVLAAFWIT